MKLAINNLVGENLSLEQVIDILDEYIPQDEKIDISLETGIGQPIKATCKKDEWVTTKEKFLLRVVNARLSSEVSHCNQCLNCIFHA